MNEVNKEKDAKFEENFVNKMMSDYTYLVRVYRFLENKNNIQSILDFEKNNGPLLNQLEHIITAINRMFEQCHYLDSIDVHDKKELYENQIKKLIKELSNKGEDYE